MCKKTESHTFFRIYRHFAIHVHVHLPLCHMHDVMLPLAFKTHFKCLYFMGFSMYKTGIVFMATPPRDLC